VLSRDIYSSSTNLSTKQEMCFTIARLKYSGGGDWYGNPTSLPNLFKKVKAALGSDICLEEKTVQLMDANIYEYPILYMTGHGNVSFSPEERKVLRQYLYHGGLLFADDNYGMHNSFLREVKSLFEQHSLYVLPKTHPVFSSHYRFPEGLPKIHKHDNKPAQLYGLDLEGRTVILYTYESDLGDGWENPEVHNNPQNVREKAFRMGVNVIAWYLQGQRNKVSSTH